MTTQTLPLLTTRIRQDDGDDESTLARQWRLLKLLAFAPKGFTIKELEAVSGISEKTVRRDLALLKHVGFDVGETMEDFGRKLYRLRRLPESTNGNGHKGEKYANRQTCPLAVSWTWPAVTAANSQPGRQPIRIRTRKARAKAGLACSITRG